MKDTFEQNIKRKIESLLSEEGHATSDLVIEDKTSNKNKHIGSSINDDSLISTLA